MYQMQHLDGLLKLVDKEFEDMEQRGKFQNPSEAHVAYELIDIVKDVHEVWECADKMSNGYSEYGYGYPMYPYDGRSYDDGSSYARGRYANRNAMGQYSRERGGNGMMNGSYEGGSSYRGRGGYSRGDAKSDYIARLYDMADSAPDNKTREHFEKMIRELEQQ